MFTQTALFYDKMYAASGKNVEREAAAVAALARARTPAAATLLDVGCGTGAHVTAFERLGFSGYGIDAELKMVALARSRLPETSIELADTTAFSLAAKFDVVVALSGTAAYARTADRLAATIACMADHLAAGGTLVVEPFLSFASYRPGVVDSICVDEPDVKIARMSLSKQTGKLAILDFHYLAATLKGVERYFERHEVGLFDETAYRRAFDAAGLTFALADVPADSFQYGLYVGGHA